MRWLTGFTFDEGEDKVAGHSGQFLVGADEVILVTDSRYTIQARREAPDAVVDEIGYALPDAGPGLLARRRRAARRDRGRRSCPTPCGAARGRGAGRRARPGRGLGRGRCASSRSPTSWSASRPRAPSPTARSRRSCPRSAPGVTEQDLALGLEWLIRTGGAEALAFDVACLAGPEAALPARRAGRPARCSTARCCCSTSAPRSRATAAT